MLIASGTERTSASARSLDSFSPLHLFDDSYIGMSDVSPVFVARRRFGAGLTHELADQLTGTRDAYTAQVTINSPSATSFINAGGGRVRYTCYGGESLEPLQFESLSYRVANISSGLDASVSQVWASGPAPVHDSIAGSISSLRNIVDAIRSRSPFRLSDETELLIQQAAQAHGAPADIATWARRLAEDVRDLSD